jgi:hypothetical protein
MSLKFPQVNATRALLFLTAAFAPLSQAATLFTHGAENLTSVQAGLSQGLFNFLSTDGGGLVELSSNYAHTGSKSFRFCYSKNEAQAALEIKLSSGQRHVYFQWWELRERKGDFVGANDYDWAGEKFNRMRSAVIGTTGVDYPLGWTASSGFGSSGLDEGGNIQLFGNSTASNGADLMTFKYAMPRGQWHKFEVELDLGTLGTANGLGRLWIDGALKAERTNVVLLPKTNATIDTIWLGGWYSGSSGPIAPACRYVDDVIIANTGPIGGSVPAPTVAPNPPENVSVQ